MVKCPGSVFWNIAQLGQTHWSVQTGFWHRFSPRNATHQRVPGTHGPAWTLGFSSQPSLPAQTQACVFLQGYEASSREKWIVQKNHKLEEQKAIEVKDNPLKHAGWIRQAGRSLCMWQIARRRKCDREADFKPFNLHFYCYGYLNIFKLMQ